MKPFAVKYPDGCRELGIGLSEVEIEALKEGKTIRFDLQSVGVGFWVKEADGSRQFVQPRHSNVVLIRGDTTEELSRFLRVDLPK